MNKLLYNSLFSSTLNYGALVWATTTIENIDMLSRLQKRVIRIIAKAPYYSHTAELFTKFNIIQVPSLYNYRLIRYYKSEIVNHDNSLAKLAGLTVHHPVYSTRNPEKWKVNVCRTNYGKQMLKFCLPSLLNKLYEEHTPDVINKSFRVLRELFL